MVQGVYVDILLVINFLVDFLLLSLLARTGGRGTQGGWRRVAAAAIGSLFSLSIFLPPLPHEDLGQLLLQVACCMLMVRLGFAWGGWRRFCKECVLLLAVSCGLFAALSLLKLFYAGTGMFVFHNAVYFHVRPPAFVLCLCGAYAFVWLIDRLLRAAAPAQRLCQVQLQVCGQCKELTGFVDSGNALVEPFSGAPVVVCDEGVAAQLLDWELLEAVHQLLRGRTDLPAAPQIRQIPFSTISQNGLLPAVKGEWMVLRPQGEGTEYWVEEFYLAVSEQPLGDGSWKLLVGEQAFHRAAANKQRKGSVYQDEGLAKTKEKTGRAAGRLAAAAPAKNLLPG